MIAAFYGGNAYNNARAKVKANQLVQDAQQIATAHQLYLLDHPGAYPPLASQFDPFTYLVSGQYLATLPVPPGSSDTYASSINYFCSNNNNPIAIGGGPCNNASDSYYNIVAILDNTNENSAFPDPGPICKQISILAKGSAGTPRLFGDPIDSNLKFDCIQDDSFFNFIYRLQ